VLFSLSDERILYLDHDEAKELEGLGIRRHQPFTVTRVRAGSSTRCEFALLPEVRSGTAEKVAAPSGAKVSQPDHKPGCDYSGCGKTFGNYILDSP
jgi:hypothetical protein